MFCRRSLGHLNAICVLNDRHSFLLSLKKEDESLTMSTEIPVLTTIVIKCVLSWVVLQCGGNTMKLEGAGTVMPPVLLYKLSTSGILLLICIM